MTDVKKMRSIARTYWYLFGFFVFLIILGLIVDVAPAEGTGSARSDYIFWFFAYGGCVLFLILAVRQGRLLKKEKMNTAEVGQLGGNE